jgi:type I restriction enzyme, S subunit
MDWPLVPLGEILVERKERVGTIDADGLPLLGVSNKAGLHRSGMVRIPDMSRYLRVEDEWFAYNPMRVNVGSIGWAQSKDLIGVISPDYVVFACTSKINPRLLHYFLTSEPGLRAINLQTAGSVRERLYFGSLAKVAMPLPPIEEQRRIVERIEGLASRVATLVQVQATMRRESSLLLQSARARLFRRLAQSGTISLSDVSVLERGKFSHRPRNDPRFFQGVHPWIQIGEIEASGKYIDRWTETLNDDGLAISKKFPSGTLLISIAATIGAVGILRFDCCIPDSIVGVTPRPGWNSAFLYHYLCYARDHLEQIAPQSAQKNINLQILSSLPVPAATPERQREAVGYLDRLEETTQNLTAHQSGTRAESDLLLPSIINHAFSGQL